MTDVGVPSPGISDLTDLLEQYRVQVDEEGEPVLVRADGSIVDTWREGYPSSVR